MRYPYNRWVKRFALFPVRIFLSDESRNEMVWLEWYEEDKDSLSPFPKKTRRLIESV